MGRQGLGKQKAFNNCFRYDEKCADVQMDVQMCRSEDEVVWGIKNPPMEDCIIQE